MRREAASASGGGIGFCGLLTIVFIALKLTGHIDWSWLWVLSPLWLPIAVVLALVGIFLIAWGCVSLLAAIAKIVRTRKAIAEKLGDSK